MKSAHPVKILRSFRSRSSSRTGRRRCLESPPCAKRGQDTLAASGQPLASDQGRPVRGRSHPMIASRGVRRLRGRLCRWIAASAKVSACWPDCRFSRASAIHSRIMARRAFGLAIWIPFRDYSDHPMARYAAFWSR